MPLEQMRYFLRITAKWPPDCSKTTHLGITDAIVAVHQLACRVAFKSLNLFLKRIGSEQVVGMEKRDVVNCYTTSDTEPLK